MRAEGWLVKRKGTRDKSAQHEVAGSLPGFDAGHLIPEQFAGSGQKKNLVPMPQRINRSYISSVENHIGRHLREGPVYLVVTVEYRDSGKTPDRVTHQLYRKAAEGWMEEIPAGSVTTAVPHSPIHKIGEVTRGKDFYDPDPLKGVRGKYPQ